MMNRILILFVFSFFLANANAQTFIKAKTISDGPGACDISATITGMNIPVGALLVQVDHTTSSPDSVFFFSDTLDGVCLGSSNPPTGLSAGLDKYFIMVPDSTDLMSRRSTSPILPLGFDFTVSNYTEPSSSTATNGEITITFNQAVIPYVNNPSSSMFSDWLTPFTHVTTDSLTFDVTGISEGIFIIAFYFNGTLYQIEGWIGDFSSTPVNNNLFVGLDLVDAQTGCDGSANVILIDSTVTGLTYTWNDPLLYGLSYVTDMCPGFYSVLVEASNGNNALFEFIITDTTNNISPPWTSVFSSVDTLNYVLSQCNLDYTQPIDSFAYIETLYSSTPDTNYYEFSMTVYQDSNSVIFIDSFYVTIDTLIVMSFGYYCDVLKAVFKGFKVYVPRGGQSVSVGLATLEKDPFSIYPNPSTGVFTISSKLDKWRVYDAMGKLCLEGKGNSIDLTSFPPSIYVLRTEEGEISRLIKQ